MTTTTETPRTEAARFEALRSAALRQDCIPLKLGQELERELNASQAEVERLKEQLESTQNLCFRFWSVLEEHGFELEINQ
jgi:hypothetical protein